MLRESLEQLYSSPIDLQKQELRNLLIHTQLTKFGKAYNFTKILKSFKGNDNDTFYEEFKKNVPVFDYDKIYNEWWHLIKEGKKRYLLAR